MQIKYLVIAAVIGLAAVPVACKKANKTTNGELNTIENITKGATSKEALALNPLCGDRSSSFDWLSSADNVEFEGAFSKSQQLRLAKAAASSMALVPPGIKEMFETFKIKVVFSDDSAPSQCASSSDAGFNTMFSDVALHACYGADAKDDDRPTIYLGQLSQSEWPAVKKKYAALDKSAQRDEFVVRQELVRVAGLIYARELRKVADKALLDSNMTAEKSAEVKAVLAPYYERRTLLSEAFAQDVKSDRAVEKRVNEVRATVVSEPGLDEQHFIDYVVGEVFHSYFCNASTVNSLEASLPLTYGAFVNHFVSGEFGQ